MYWLLCASVIGVLMPLGEASFGWFTSGVEVTASAHPRAQTTRINGLDVRRYATLPITSSIMAVNEHLHDPALTFRESFPS